MVISPDSSNDIIEDIVYNIVCKGRLMEIFKVGSDELWKTYL